MTFKEYLKAQGLEEAQIEAITSGMAENKFFIASEEKLDERYQKAKSKAKQLEEDLKNANTLIEDLKTKSNTADDIQNKLTEYEKTIQELTTQREKDALNSFVDLNLTQSQAKNLKAVKALLDFETIKKNDKGEFEGLNEQIEALKESAGYLFNGTEPEQPETPKFAGGNPNNEPSSDDSALMRGFDKI